jgi:site-specific DNA-methyltransferase (adenine-specific)
MADFLKLELPEESVNLIITSPPYNIGIDYGEYDDNKTYEDYLDFSESYLKKSFYVLKNDGRICINVPIDTSKQSLSLRDKRSLAADLTILAKRAGLKYKGTIIWNKQNVRNKFSMTFSKNIEVILVFYKDEWKPVSIEFRNWVNEIWTFAGESTKRLAHPAPFPVEIPRRLIKMFTEKGEIVLDPFVGSGTTMVASELLGRYGIGVEIDGKYFERACERIKMRKW